MLQRKSKNHDKAYRPNNLLKGKDVGRAEAHGKEGQDTQRRRLAQGWGTGMGHAAAVGACQRV